MTNPGGAWVHQFSLQEESLPSQEHRQRTMQFHAFEDPFLRGNAVVDAELDEEKFR